MWCRPTPTPRSLFAPGGAQRNHPALRGKEMGSARRKLQPLKVYCTEEERGRIERQAEMSGMRVLRLGISAAGGAGDAGSKSCG